MTAIRDRAVVLRNFDLKESDRIVVLFSENHGKIRAIARGVRKTLSKFGARLQPLSQIDVLYSETRGFAYINQVETVKSNPGLYENLDRLTQALAMSEAVDKMTLENQSSPQVYSMLVGALDWLAEHDSPIVLAAFYLKLLKLEGFGAHVESCVGCQSTSKELVAFDILLGGAQCRECRSGVSMSASSLDLIARILGGNLNHALAAQKGTVTSEVSSLATRLMEHHLERRLKSVSIFEHWQG